MKRSRTMAQKCHQTLLVFALLLSGIAAVLLLLAFQTESSGIGATPSGKLCVSLPEYAARDCAGSFAIVKSDNPWMFRAGFSLMIAGVIGQIGLTIWNPER